MILVQNKLLVLGVEGLLFKVPGFVDTKLQHSNPPNFKYAPCNYYQCKFSAHLLEVAKGKYDIAIWFTWKKINFFLQKFDWIKAIKFVFFWGTSQCTMNNCKIIRARNLLPIYKKNLSKVFDIYDGKYDKFNILFIDEARYHSGNNRE